MYIIYYIPTHIFGEGYIQFYLFIFTYHFLYRYLYISTLQTQIQMQDKSNYHTSIEKTHVDKCINQTFWAESRLRMPAWESKAHKWVTNSPPLVRCSAWTVVSSEGATNNIISAQKSARCLPTDASQEQHLF